MSEFQQVVQEGKKKVVSGIKRILLIILALVILGGASYVWVCSWTYSEGTRAGTLIKISDKGVVFKTYEGQLNLGGFQQSAAGGGIQGNIWDFSVAKRDIFEKLQNYEGKQVKLAYKQRYKTFPWQGDTEYFVVGVEEVK